MRYKLSEALSEQFVTSDRYWSFQDEGKFLEYMLASYDERFRHLDTTLNIYDIQDIDVPPRRYNELNVLLCVENCMKDNSYRHHAMYGDYGDTNIQIYIYNHIDTLVLTDTYIAIPLLWFRLSYLRRNYETIKPSIVREDRQRLFCILMTDNKRNRGVKAASYKALSRLGKVFTMSEFRKSLYNESVYLTERFLNFTHTFRFAIVCENSSAPGYITEKILQCYHARVVPIYWGNSPERYFNSNSFINLREIETEDELLSRVSELMTNAAKYNEMVDCPKLKEPDTDYFADLVDFIEDHTPWNYHSS